LTDSVDPRSQEDASGRPAVAVPGPQGGSLTYAARIGCGVHAEVDLLRPAEWCGVTADRADGISDALVGAVVRDRGHSAATWLRVAVVDALDRWLHLPLDQTIVDAERGVARARAAVELTDPAARDAVLADALGLARRASAGVVAYLRSLRAAARAVPKRLLDDLACLVEGYVLLAGNVTGVDRDLEAVPRTWKSVLATVSTAVASADGADPARVARGPRPRPRVSARATSLIDPRRVRARLLGLSRDPGDAEISLDDPHGDGSEVRVQVPAYGRRVDPELARCVVVRLVDRRSAEPRGHALLRVGRVGGRPYFEGTLPLRGSTVDDLRADVYDAADETASSSDSDADLRVTRRATVFLSDWRRLVAHIQLPSPAVVPSRCLRSVVDTLERAVPELEGLVTPSGPALTELRDLLAVDDDELRHRLGADVPTADGVGAITAGPARLLVAELASVYEESGGV
jgi:hypothetical protein